MCAGFWGGYLPVRGDEKGGKGGGGEGVVLALVCQVSEKEWSMISLVPVISHEVCRVYYLLILLFIMPREEDDEWMRFRVDTRILGVKFSAYLGFPRVGRCDCLGSKGPYM